ncbi:MAG: helix-turn-helix transcriptional regulator [Bacteroidota bacterium]
MHTEVFQPRDDLSAFIRSYWILESKKETTPQINTIVPDGTMKLIFHYKDLYWHHPPSDAKFLQPRSFLIGQLTRPYLVEPSGDTGTFIVRFEPYGFLPFATIPLKEIENTPISLEVLFGEEGKRLEMNILQSETTHERIQAVEVFLLQQLQQPEVIDRIVEETVATISKANGHLRVKQIVADQELNGRVLSRKFRKTVGLSPKQLSKIIRIQTTLKKLLTTETEKMTDVAYQNKYFDQAHFIKEFKEFTGLTPKAFFGDHLKMSLIFEGSN